MCNTLLFDLYLYMHAFVNVVMCCMIQFSNLVSNIFCSTFYLHIKLNNSSTLMEEDLNECIFFCFAV
uniref:Uncharacterized protein n=1 Tax=Arundo donax TaxID=35708 RepID=A0A0A9HDZ0_ARUDO